MKQADWPTSPIDYFVLSKLEENGLRPAPPADRLTLIRRATFDLLGLPPTPAEVDQFLADESPEAFARLVERLLESPHYGERWGRHWLDVARYADSNGLDENIAHGNAWRYRDWVVAAFNADRPFDLFLREQIAGDLLPTDDAELRRQRLIATGFLTLGPKVLAEVDETKMEMDIVDEQIDTLGRAVMGMTFGCARCHDHKFDPIGTADYYALAGIFKSTRTMDSFTKIARWHENSIATEAELAAKAEHDQQVATKKSEIDSLVAAANEQLKQSLGEGAALPDKPETQYPEETKQRLKQLRDALTTLEKAAPAMSTAMGVTDGDARNVAVHIRGSHLTLGDEASRGWPRVLSHDTSFNIGETESGRLQLADWLTRPDHPLTGRVFVNRIWRWHFGRGIVGSTDNFGELGERPLNPELLDWLTVEFAEQGWSIKTMHRLMMLSSVYRMSSTHDPECAAIDPENRWQWRAGVRRLEAEAIRDAMLAVSGTLDPTMGGSLLHVGNREFIFNHTSKDETKYDAPRRSLYLPVIRNHLYDVFQLFDYTDAGVVNGDRSTSTVAPQALFMMNSELVSDAATALARRALNEPLDSDEARVAWLYRSALARPAAEHEVQRASEFVASLSEASEGTAGDDTRLAAWRSLCHVLLTSNEFIYVR
ncbi:MAG: DUF1549 and DUF1553 domain-containing protein [Pirellulaceae bacterium]